MSGAAIELSGIVSLELVRVQALFSPAPGLRLFTTRKNPGCARLQVRNRSVCSKMEHTSGWDCRRMSHTRLKLTEDGTQRWTPRNRSPRRLSGQRLLIPRRKDRMKPEFRDLVELVRATAWPVTVIAAVFFFRKPLSQFLANLGQRVKKFSIFEFALELSSVPEFTPSWSAPSLSDVRQPSPADQFSSYAMALIEQIRSDAASDYAVIDLGTGQQWLTSRLFIFAVLLQRMRALRCFVFVETAGETHQKFIAMASPEGVRWGLARRYPWLEQAFAQSYGNLWSIQILSNSGALDTGLAT